MHDQLLNKEEKKSKGQTIVHFGHFAGPKSQSRRHVGWLYATRYVLATVRLRKNNKSKFVIKVR